MPFYNEIRYPKRFKGQFKQKERLRTVSNLVNLRKHIRDEIPAKTINETLLLATWNLRNFTSQNRITESYFYIAEILSAFDIIALQEIGDNLEPFEHVMKILGGRYKSVVTDVTEGDKGNSERLAFVYDTRKVSFEDVAGEIVLPPDNLIIRDVKLPPPPGKKKGKVIQEKQQFARTPFLAAFQARWFKFYLCNVHILYGDIMINRVREIQKISEIIAERALKPRRGSKKGYNYILMGDFNVVRPHHVTMQPLIDAGFELFKELERPTTPGKDKKYYDQIVFKPRRDEVKLGPGLVEGTAQKRNAGVFAYYNWVFAEDDYKTYWEYCKKKTKAKTEAGKKRYFRQYFRTFQMSDHYPMWVELKIDFSDRYLTHRQNELKKELGIS